MRDAYEAVLKLAAHDPVIATGLVTLSLVIVPLAGLHLIRIFGGLLVVVLQEFKNEVRGIGKVAGRVWFELTSWKSEP